MNTNRFLDPDDRPFVNIRVHSWLNFLSNRFLNIEGENAVIALFAALSNYWHVSGTVSKSRNGCYSPESRKFFSAAIFSERGSARVAQTGSLRGFRIITIRKN